MHIRQVIKRFISSVNSNCGPLSLYDLKVKDGKLRNDDFQRGVVAEMESLYHTIEKYNPPPVELPSLSSLQPKKGIFSFLAPKPKPFDLSKTPKGIYLYGDVGCGKTMLMDLFYDTIPAHLTKKRIHFHSFMQNVHHRIHDLHIKYGNDLNAIPHIGATLAEESTVLCFDEFQVTDVADAMLLRFLLESLIHNGVVLFMTSNRSPDDLYLNGVQRQSFIPCIELLKERTKVINLDSPTDYRKIPRPTSNVYFTSLSDKKAAQKHVDDWFAYFADPKDPQPHPDTLTVWGRTIAVPRASGSAVAQFSFKDLCEQPMSSADYLAITQHYKAMIITDIPILTINQKDFARRFITLIDAIYENKVKLVCTSATTFDELFVSEGRSEEDEAHLLEMAAELDIPPELMKSSNFFTGDEEIFAFARAYSRLVQMSSQEWLNN
ncbi:hypothetical protein CANCADRAFT_2747 [Tortispora caseinolytica NRRL Y-17796]|uniref:AAA+ ATPase domain-containing protein n=1 Tax=Tortispora caseinolytica NRRL Y-17796 TaxID=767744 RepID=A0A1E4TGZ8_9ASCO|nr:hypothetical protein CANCADRAFT_2747 [Tortispora caseinolytica NRRL Y-17796]